MAKELFNQSKKFCETYSIATEDKPLREPIQTDKFIQRVKAYLELQGVDTSELEVTPVDILQGPPKPFNEV